MRQTSTELADLVVDRPLITSELHIPNDWYGHASVIKRYAGIESGYSIKGVIEHGIAFSGKVEQFEAHAPLPVAFVTSVPRMKALKAASQKTTFILGNYLAYTPYLSSLEELERERKRLGRTLLVMPAHSTHHIDALYDINAYCVALSELGKDFQTVQVCLYWKDVLRGMAEVYKAYGFEVVTAGHMYDTYFLPRLKSIIDSASVVTMNFIGSQVGYAVYLNKPVHYLSIGSVKSKLADDGDPAVYIPDFEEVARYPGQRMLIEQMKELRSDIPNELRQLVGEIWGFEHIRHPYELRELIYLAEELYNHSRTGTHHIS